MRSEYTPPAPDQSEKLTSILKRVEPVLAAFKVLEEGQPALEELMSFLCDRALEMDSLQPGQTQGILSGNEWTIRQDWEERLDGEWDFEPSFYEQMDVAMEILVMTAEKLQVVGDLYKVMSEKEIALLNALFRLKKDMDRLLRNDQN